MKNTNQNNSNGDLTAKLALQVSSFQEGFKILSNVSSLKELGKKFYHILRGSLFITNVNIYHKKNIDNGWQPLYVSVKNSNNLLTEYKNYNSLQLNFLENQSFKIYAILPMTDGSYFGILLGEKLDHSEYVEIDKILIQIFLQLLDNAYQAYLNRINEKELLFSLNHRVLQLNNLIDTGIEISKLHERDNLLETALERAITLTNASGGMMRAFRKRKLVASSVIPSNMSRRLILNSDYKIAVKFEFQGYRYEFLIANKESRKGFTEFEDTDRILIEAIGRQVLAAIENEHLHKEALEKENIERELKVAASIQQKIIPKSLPEIPGYQIAGINIPSKDVGGDYYDCKKLDDGRYALIIADVTGKGVSAALLVSTLNASLNAYLDMDIPLSELGEKINKVIYEASPPDKFITFFISILNPDTGEMEIMNAGHNPSLVLKNNGSLEKLEAGGVALGMFNMNLPFSVNKTILQSGEKILLFTDGIPEAMNENEEEYSDERLEQFFKRQKSENAHDFIEDLLNDVKSFVKNTPQSDDITSLYLFRK